VKNVDAAPSRVGEILAEKYRITRFLGEGGMGTVYEAQHTIVGRRFAVKYLHAELAGEPESLERFRREARAAGALENENIVPVIDFGTASDGIPYLVMEFLVGEDLASLLRRDGPLSVVRAVNLIIQACRGLDAAHTAGIIHRDLKPENLFVCRRGDGTDLVKILDFGIAKLSQAGVLGPMTPVTRSGATMGTPFTMPPEQARGAKVIDHRADIYSLGVILFEALSGTRPHPGESYNEIMYHILTKPPVPIESQRPGLHADLVDLIHRAIAFEPQDRPGSAAEFARALAAHAGRQVTPIRSQFDLQVTRGSDPPPDARAPTEAARVSPEVARTPPRRMGKGQRWMAVGVVGLAAVGAAAWLLRSPGRPSFDGDEKAIMPAPSTVVPAVAADTQVIDARPTPAPGEPISVHNTAEPNAASPPTIHRVKAAKQSRHPHPGVQPEPPAAPNRPVFDERNPYR
jgi:eukaryotic-like serine/threonine-protein kinase